MAEENVKVTNKSVAGAPAPTEPAPVSRIIKAADSPRGPDKAKADPSLAGHYEVTHGALVMGPNRDLAHPGSIVDLSAVDASNLLGAGVVKRLKTVT